MAGYIIYSLDWNKFKGFIDNPTREQLLAFASLLSDELDEHDGEFDDDDPVHDWPSEPEELAAIAQERLKRPDWYGDLSDTGKNIWEGALNGFCMDQNSEDVDFRVDSDGVYWPVIDIVRAHHGIKQNRITESPLSHFGTRPYRFHPDSKYRRYDDWTSNHSMHTPEEVHQILAALKEAGPIIAKTKDADARRDYEEELLPALEQIASENRMLYIGVDT